MQKEVVKMSHLCGKNNSSKKFGRETNSEIELTLKTKMKNSSQKLPKKI